MRNRQAVDLMPILALAAFIININGSVSPPSPVLTGPSMAYLHSRVAFRCVAPDSPPPVTYQLQRDDNVGRTTVTDLQGGQPASFFLKASAASEGSYRCRATAGGHTGVSNAIRLSVVIPPLITRVTSEPSPPVAYEGSRIVLACTVVKGSHLSYTWFFNRKQVTTSTSPPVHLIGNQLVMEKLTQEHSGAYYCMAWSMVQDIKRFSSSMEVQVTVRVSVSKPNISFSVSKEGNSYRGNITCWSTKGSLPVNFSLLVDHKEVGLVTANQSLNASFSIPMDPGLDMGVAVCRVKTDQQELTSEPVTLEVVPVGGDVKMEVDYLYMADSKMAAVRLRCLLGRGTFPHVSWLLNNSVITSETLDHTPGVLPVQSRFSFSDNGQTLVLTRLDREQSGFYRCRVRDSYDESGPQLESAEVLVRDTEVFMYTTEVITLTFCCFLLLMMAAAAVCMYKMFDLKRARADSALTNSDEIPLSGRSLDTTV